MTIRKHISAVRVLSKQTSNSTAFKDPFLYHMLSTTRAWILSRELNSKSKLNQWNFQTFCIELALETYSDCSCLPSLNCKVLKSIVAIPAPLSTKYSSILKLTDPTGEVEYYPSSPMKEKMYLYSKTRNNRLGWDLINGHIVIFIKGKKEAMPPKVVQITMVAEDPLQLSTITTCTPTGEATNNCYSLDDEWPIELKLVPAIYDTVVKQLRETFTAPEDISNDAQSVTTDAVV